MNNKLKMLYPKKNWPAKYFVAFHFSNKSHVYAECLWVSIKHLTFKPSQGVNKNGRVGSTFHQVKQNINDSINLNGFNNNACSAVVLHLQ